MKNYQDFIKRLTKEKANEKAIALQVKIDGIMARAHRKASRVDDCGPIDMVWEKVKALETQIQTYKWFIAHGEQEPTRDLAAALLELFQDKAQTKERKAIRKEEAQAYESLVGKIIHYEGPKAGKGKSLCVKQKAAKWGRGIRYTLANGWRIPSQYVTRSTNPKEGDDNLSEVLGKANSLRDLMVTSIGKNVEWASRKLQHPSGKAVDIRGKKLVVDVRGREWKVPFSLITSIDGRRV